MKQRFKPISAVLTHLEFLKMTHCDGQNLWRLQICRCLKGVLIVFLDFQSGFYGCNKNLQN